MLTYYFFAFRLEMMMGSINFLILYFSAAIISDISSILKYRDVPEYRSVGASGAIAAVLFSYILFEPASKIMVFLLPIPLPAPVFALLYLAYCYFAAKRGGDYINHDAHLWGSVSGIIITVILVPQVVQHFIREVF